MKEIIKESAEASMQETEDRLQEMYEKLADLIPEALAEDFVGRGYVKGKYYDSGKKRLLVVEKIPRPEKEGCCSQQQHSHHNQQEDERDFTGVVACVVGQLLEGEAGNSKGKGKATEDWQEYLAWSYLYKLAPRMGKPDDTIYRKQKALCGEIIKKEIQLLNPTHVLFLTGWGGIWDFDLPLSSILKGEAVEGWGKTEDGVNFLVTRYAVRGPENEFAMDIVEKFLELERI